MNIQAKTAAQSKPETASGLNSSDPVLATVQIPTAFEFLFRPARYKACWGGRGSAKSHSFATALVTKAAESPLRIVSCREIQRSIRDSVKRLLDDKIAACNLGKFYESTDSEIRGANGSLFVFAGLRTNFDAIKSMEAIDIAWVEEAHTVSQRSLDVLIPTIRQENSELWFSWNPRFPTDPVDALFRSGNPPPNAVVHEVGWRDNPWFPKVLRAEMEWDRKRDAAKYNHIWGGGYRQNTEAQVFKNWRIGTEDEFNPPEDTEFYFGGDWGFAQDPTVLVRSYLEGRTLKVDYEVWQIGCEIDKTPQLFEKVPGSDKWPIIADSARPETISYMQRHGYPGVQPARKGAGSVEEGVEFLKSYDIVVHPRCRHMIDELIMYSYKVDKLTELVLPILEDANNHCVDSLRYAMERARLTIYEWGVVDWQS